MKQDILEMTKEVLREMDPLVDPEDRLSSAAGGCEASNEVVADARMIARIRMGSGNG